MRSGKWTTYRWAASAMIGLGMAHGALAADGTWNSPSGGNWSDSSKWVGGVIADGANSTANFNTQNISDQTGVTGVVPVQVDLDTPRTIGHLIFGDADNGATPGTWEVTSLVDPVTNLLTLADATKPTITVNQLGVISPTPGFPPVFDDAVIRPSLVGTNGFNKLGAGILTLAGTNPNLTGAINVNAGTLRIASTATFDNETTVTPAVTSFNLANGTTMELAATVGRIKVATGATATVRVTATGTQGSGINANVPGINGSGTGETLNLQLATANIFDARGDWGQAAGTALANVNVTGQDVAQGRLRLHINGGSFQANSFLNSRVDLNNTFFSTRTNSGGNDVAIGALAGTSTATLSGGEAGSVVRYSIGNLNTNTTFAGTVATGSGISLYKVGTGTLTLSGPLTYTTTNNATAANRGGVTRVAAGTLALTGDAAIPGGTVDGTLGNLPTTIDVRAGATFNVAGTNTTYSTAALQQVIGAGTIAGNYNHDEGMLAPGDVPAGNTNNLTATAGTLTFANNLDFAGSGEIRLNVSPNLGSGNDLIRVNGVTSLTGTPTLNFGFLGGFTAGAYTLLQSDGGFGGTNTSGWTVNWPGRGAPTLSTSGNLLQLIVGSGSTSANLNWTGNAGSDWVAGSGGPLNWHNNGTNAADRYFDQDIVTFADTAGPGNTPVANGNVVLGTAISPISVTVNNSAVAYSITGAGKITGASGLTKSGNGTLTLQTANDFTGPTQINGGTVDIGVFNTALGTGLLTLSNGTLSVANTAASGLSNSGLALPAGTASTLNANGGTAALTVPTLSGDGNLSIASTTAAKLVDLSTNNAAYTGDLTLGSSGVATVFRTSGAGSGFANSAITLVGASLRDRATSVQTIALGSLTGDAASVLYGYQGGSGATAKTWQIGALNTSTTFAGSTINGSGSNSTRALTNIIKVGTGTLTLSGALAHGGTTTVSGGTLLVNGTHLVDTSTPAPATAFTVGDYIVNNGGTLGGTGTIGDVADPGAVVVTVNNGGRLAPGAGGVGTLSLTNGDVVLGAGGVFDVEINSGGVSDVLALSGNGTTGGNLTLDPTSILNVASLGGAPVGNYTIATYTGTLTGTFGNTGGYSVNYSTPGQIILNFTGVFRPGDFNKDGSVNATDLGIWRGAAGTSSLGDADGDGDSDGNDFVLWQRNLGLPPSVGAAGAVPEPGTLSLIAAAGLLGLALGRSRTSRA